MSLAKIFTNLTKGGKLALSGVASYVDNKIAEKRDKEFQDKLSKKPRKEFGGQVMTDNEVENFNNKIQEYIEIDKQAKEFAKENGFDYQDETENQQETKTTATEEHKTKTEKTNKKRNLQKIDDEKYKPNGLDHMKAMWDNYYASKHQDTGLMYFLHPGNNDQKYQTCESIISQEYDKRYGNFFCIDTHNADDPDIYDKMLNSMENFIEKNLPTLKFYLDAHGHYENDYLALKYSMDDLKKLLSVFSGEFDGKTVIFVKVACYDGDTNAKYGFDFEETVKTFSEMNPNTTVIIEEHIDKESEHWVTPRKYTQSHNKLKYRIMKNGVEKTTAKKEKNKSVGGSFADKQSYSPAEDIPWKGFLVFLPTVLLASFAYLGKEGIRCCYKRCKQKKEQQNLQQVAIQNNNDNNDNNDNHDIVEVNNNNNNNNNNNILLLNNNHTITSEFQRINVGKNRIKSSKSDNTSKKINNNDAKIIKKKSESQSHN